MKSSESTQRFIDCISPAGPHRMAYTEWGDPENPRVLLCLHGLLRTGRDFDEVAKQLSPHYRVICPDIVGRGASDWLADPTYYAVPQYVSDILTLIAHLKPQQLDWVGTSMGGLIALSVAAVKQSFSESPIPFGKLVLNDVGPELNPEGLARIAQYVSSSSQFSSWPEVIQTVRHRWVTFGPHTDEQWAQLAKYVFTQQGTGWSNAYDPDIALAFQQQLELDRAQQGQLIELAQQTLWQAFDALTEPCLIVRGEFSDLLSPDTAHEMLVRQSQAVFYQVAGVGHAPTFMQDDQLRVLSQFLLKE